MPIGRTVDRWGGRVAVTIYSALFFLSVIGLSFPRDWLSLTVAFGMLRALGVGGLELSCNTCLQQWFSRRRGLATGVGQSINAILSYAVISNLVALAVHQFGWRKTYVLCGGTLLVVYTPIAWLLVRSQPEDIGLLPDGGIAMSTGENGVSSGSQCSTGGNGVSSGSQCSTGGNGVSSGSQDSCDLSNTDCDHTDASAERVVHTSAAHANTSACHASLHTSEDSSWTLNEAVQTRCFLLLAASNAFAWGIGSGLFFNMASIVSEAGLPRELLAPSLYVPWAVSRATSNAIAGCLLDRLPPRVLLCGGLLLASCGILLLSPPLGLKLSPQLAALFGVLHGFGNGTTALIFKAAPASFFGRRHLGAIGGCLSTLNVGSTAIGPLLVGASFDLLGSYTACVRGISAATAVMAFMCLGMHPPVRQVPPVRQGGQMTPVPVVGEAANAQADADPVAPVKAPGAGQRTDSKRAKYQRAYAQLEDENG